MKKRSLKAESPSLRDRYAKAALDAMPRLLLMIDRNRLSPSFGCFDRSYWHYRTMDFPCGMNQEFVLPLALAYVLPMPENKYYKNERIRELIFAAISFAQKGSHPDGTTDDYFPFERAMGALVFSLYAMTESCLLLKECRDEDLAFFRRRGDWLLKHNESGQLANHQALAALALYNVYLLAKEEKYRRGSNAFRDLTLSWASGEGWFQEYEGADPGYHTASIGFFSKLWQKSNDAKIFRALREAVHFAHHFMHPDGSYGGEYGSRNTYHFYPHGFEVMAPFEPLAGEIADSFLTLSLPNGTRYFNDDDRMAAHYVYDWMMAWRDFHPERQGAVRLPERTQTRWFPKATILVVRTPAFHLVVNGSKGGTLKAISPAGAFASSTGLIGELSDGKAVVTHLVAKNKVRFDDNRQELRVEGRFQRRRAILPTPFKNILFRCFMLTVGRFNANAVRKILQRILIVQKAPMPLFFERIIRWDDEGFAVTDRVRRTGKIRFRSLASPTDATSIYVANSNTWQDSMLLPWEDFSKADIDVLNRIGKITRTRVYRPAELQRATETKAP